MGYLFGSVFLIAMGALMLYPKTFKRFVNFVNETRGAASEITQNTLIAGRIVGALLVALGVYYMFIAIAALQAAAV